MTTFFKFISLCLLFASVTRLPAEQPATTITHPIDWASRKFTVLFFLLHDCPISNGYLPELNRIAQEYRGRDLQFIAVYSDAGFSEKAAREHAREYQLSFPFVIDKDKQLAASTGTKIAPEAAVLNNKKELLYRGRIDDLYADIDERRPAAVHRDLREALAEIVAGRKPKRAQVPGVGCPIEDRRPGS